MGITPREVLLESVAEVDPWERFSIEDPHVVPLGRDAAALIYTAEAKRANRPVHAAAMTSVYRKRGDEWELVLHQQTPLGD